MTDINLVKKKLSTLLNDDGLVEKYLKQYGSEINIKYIKHIKSNSGGKSGSRHSSAPGEDPTFSIKVRCPVCKQDGITCTELKAKSQSVKNDHFMNPVYTGASGFKTVDYSRMAVAVCHRCFFASSNKKDFITYSMTTRTEVNSTLGPMILSKLKDKIQVRKDIMGFEENPIEFFNHPRSAKAAIMSYKLSIMRVEIEIELETPYSLYKAGTYALRIAQIRKSEGHADDEALKLALEYYSRSFSSSNVPNQDLENQIIYVIAALNLRLNQEKQTQDYIKVLEKLKSELMEKQKTNPAIKTASVETWLNRAKNLWEDREYPELWK